MNKIEVPAEMREANETEMMAVEGGAVTVDWVVLTAAIVGLGVAALTAVQGGMTALASSIQPLR